MNSLQRNNNIYKSFVENIFNKPPTTLDPYFLIRSIQTIARWAYYCHPGVFTDPIIEGHLTYIGENLPASKHIPDTYNTNFSISGNKVLHIASTIYNVGGHAKIIENWITIDKVHQHHLLLTSQAEYDIPQTLIDVISNSGGIITRITETDVFEKCLQIREISQSGFDYIILHSHPEDAIPIIALHTDNVPPIAIMNHADHAYWLGSGLTSNVINIREEAARISKQYRGATYTPVLPIPLVSQQKYTREEARQNLKILDTDLLAISIGSYHKFLPDNGISFFEVCRQLLENIPNLYIKVIGISKTDDLNRLKYIAHERLTLEGIQQDISRYITAADFVIDPIPLGSYTALLEATADGCYPLMLKSKLDLFDLSRDVALQGQISSQTSVDKLIDTACSISSDRKDLDKKRLEISQAIKHFHSGDKWITALNNIYSTVKRPNNKKNAISKHIDINIKETLASMGNIHFNKQSEVLANYIFANAQYIPINNRLKLIKTLGYLLADKSVTYRLKTYLRFIFFN